MCRHVAASTSIFFFRIPRSGLRVGSCPSYRLRGWSKLPFLCTDLPRKNQTPIRPRRCLATTGHYNAYVLAGGQAPASYKRESALKNCANKTILNCQRGREAPGLPLLYHISMGKLVIGLAAAPPPRAGHGAWLIVTPPCYGLVMMEPHVDPLPHINNTTGFSRGCGVSKAFKSKMTFFHRDFS